MSTHAGDDARGNLARRRVEGGVRRAGTAGLGRRGGVEESLGVLELGLGLDGVSAVGVGVGWGWAVGMWLGGGDGRAELEGKLEGWLLLLLLVVLLWRALGESGRCIGYCGLE